MEKWWPRSTKFRRYCFGFAPFTKRNHVMLLIDIGSNYKRQNAIEIDETCDKYAFGHVANALVLSIPFTSFSGD